MCHVGFRDIVPPHYNGALRAVAKCEQGLLLPHGVARHASLVAVHDRVNGFDRVVRAVERSCARERVRRPGQDLRSVEGGCVGLVLLDGVRL